MASVGNLSYYFGFPNCFDIKTMFDYIAINEAIGYFIYNNDRNAGNKVKVVDVT